MSTMLRDQANREELVERVSQVLCEDGTGSAVAGTAPDSFIRTFRATSWNVHPIRKVDNPGTVALSAEFLRRYDSQFCR